nr:protein phosphatase 2C 16-like isoform X1 [Tanacetum cinerariifolium]
MATFSLANSLSENTSLSNHVSFTRVKLLTETASLLSDMGSKTVSNEDSSLSQANLVKVPLVVANSVSLPIVEKNHSKGVKSVYELEYIPLWGSQSVIGKRPEMEDAVVVVPRFMEVPIKMFVGDHVVDGVNSSLTSLTTHFFGVYDGHGGSQVANYCSERVHVALEEELKAYAQETINDTLQVQWEKVFTNCFTKVDDEVGGKISRQTLEAKGDTVNVTSEPVAPETVGSTAVVAVINSSHIILANCGDSRAVLYRGKEVVALSNDHKPNREDELARIEAAGGKVIQWNGHRVLGVLAMSRSIGDRYLKPCIIPNPEVTFTARAREDECLVLASDGLWDVMSNEEVCEVARKRILIWHKKNGGNVTDKGNGNGVDHAAQAAADYLVMLALQKGSKDNTSVIVVDLKAQRKFKTKS